MNNFVLINSTSQMKWTGSFFYYLPVFVYAESVLLRGLFFSCGGGFSSEWLLLLWSMGSRACRFQQLRHVGSVAAVPGLQSSGSMVVVHRLSCPAAYGILPDQGLNLFLLPRQAKSLPLSHQGSRKWTNSLTGTNYQANSRNR